MTEINNFNNFGISKISSKKANNEEKIEKPISEDVKEQSLVQDTGVLGRSQVNFKGGNMQASIDEALAMMEKNPELLQECDNLFNKTYDDLTQNKGMDPTDAYFAASEIAGQTAELAANTNI